MTSCLIFSSEYYKFGNENNDTNIMNQSRNLSLEILPLAIQTILEKNDRLVCMTLVHNISKSIQIIGKDIFQNQQILDSVMDMVLKVLSEQVACQESEEELGDEDQAEHDQLLIEYTCEILPITCNSIGYANFQKYFETGFYQILLKRAHAKKNSTTKAASLGAIADIIKVSGENLANACSQDLIPVFLSNIQDPENNEKCRNHSIYGLGILVSVGIKTCHQKYPEVLGVFSEILNDEETEDTVKDQVLGSVGRMILAANQNSEISIDTDSILKALLTQLPIQADPMELEPVLSALEKYIPDLPEGDLKKVVRNISEIIESFGKHNLQSDTLATMANFLAIVSSSRSSVLECLSEEEMAAIKDATETEFKKKVVCCH